jgi:hypothetical protein
MEDIFMWVGSGGAAMFVVAVAVAWWEHLNRSRQPPSWAVDPAPRLLQVDLHLDALASAPGDVGVRQAALEGALDRMTQPAAGTAAAAWIETRPMILQPTQAEPATARQAETPGT